jgi:GDPmannose 4,6-dehydratase
VSGRQIRFVQASSSEIFGAALQNPQDENTPIAPHNPYGASKAFAHFMVQVYRDRGLFASNAILYNHESPRRPITFVTRKIISGVAAIALGRADTITLGNLDARRDWSWAGDVVDALVLIAAADEPDDFVVASGISHTVRDFVEVAFAAAGVDDWESHVTVDSDLIRPADAPDMRGDASKIRNTLGWTPSMTFEQVVAAMVDHDIAVLGGS